MNNFCDSLNKFNTKVIISNNVENHSCNIRGGKLLAEKKLIFQNWLKPSQHSEKKTKNMLLSYVA